MGGSWTVGDGDTKPWLGALFTHYVTVMGLITQGAGDTQEWVIDFNVMYRLQYGSFYEYVRDLNGTVKASLSIPGLYHTMDDISQRYLVPTCNPSTFHTQRSSAHYFIGRRPSLQHSRPETTTD